MFFTTRGSFFFRLKYCAPKKGICGKTKAIKNPANRRDSLLYEWCYKLFHGFVHKLKGFLPICIETERCELLV